MGGSRRWVCLRAAAEAQAERFMREAAEARRKAEDKKP
jgi:hypothetical protein